MARRKSTPIEDVIFVASKLPWWAGVTLALVSYVVLHSIAAKPMTTVVTGPESMEVAARESLFRTIAIFGQLVFPVIFTIAAVVSFAKSKRQKKLYEDTAARSGVASLLDMTWQEFEQMVGEHFRRLGFQVSREGGNGPDGGIDLVLRQKSETYLVQCKQWKAYKVGVQPVREFYGVMASRGAAGGYFVTSGEFTSDAREFARGSNIELIDGKKLRGILDAVRSPVMQTKTVPRTVKQQACPQCGAEMTLRTARKGSNAGKEFWGCSTYPTCKGTLPLETIPKPPEPVSSPATTRTCPDCGTEMSLRQFQSGPRSGQQFHACVTCKKGWPVGQTA